MQLLVEGSVRLAWDATDRLMGVRVRLAWEATDLLVGVELVWEPTDLLVEVEPELTWAAL